MKPKKFLMWVGWFLVGWGVVGYFIGDLWMPVWGFTAGENLAHVVVGAVMLAAAYWGQTKSLLTWLTVIVGLMGLFFAGYGWFVSSSFRGLADFELLDNVIHLLVGLWALWVVWGKRR